LHCPVKKLNPFFRFLLSLSYLSGRLSFYTCCQCAAKLNFSVYFRYSCEDSSRSRGTDPRIRGTGPCSRRTNPRSRGRGDEFFPLSWRYWLMKLKCT